MDIDEVVQLPDLISFEAVDTSKYRETADEILELLTWHQLRSLSDQFSQRVFSVTDFIRGSVSHEVTVLRIGYNSVTDGSDERLNGLKLFLVLRRRYINGDPNTTHVLAQLGDQLGVELMNGTVPNMLHSGDNVDRIRLLQDQLSTMLDSHMAELN